LANDERLARVADRIETPSWEGQHESQRVREGWTFRTAAADKPEQVFACFDESQRVTERVVAEIESLDTLAQEPAWDGEQCSLRWIPLHHVPGVRSAPRPRRPDPGSG